MNQEYELTPMEFRQISSLESAWRRNLVGLRREIIGEWAENTIELLFNLVSSGESELYQQIYFGNSSLWIGFDQWNHLPGVNQLLDETPISDLPTPLQSAALGTACESILQVCESIFECSIELGEVSTEVTDSNLLSVGLTLKLNEGEQAIHGAIHGDDASLMEFSQIMEAFPVSEIRSMDDFSMECPLQIGTCRVTLDEVQSLKRYDVLMMETRAEASEEELPGLLHVPPHITWTVSIQEDSILLRERIEPPIDEELTGTDLSLTLQLTLGVLSCSPLEIAEFEPGERLEFQTADHAVVRYNGRPLFRGELVTINGQSGVRIMDRPSSDLSTFIETIMKSDSVELRS